MGDVLIDTSVWIEFFREPRSRWSQAVDLLLGEGRVCTTGLVMVEVIAGAKDRSEFERLRTDFTVLDRIDPLPSVWEEILELRWKLRSRGIAGVSVPDLIIAHVVLAHRKILLTRDQDFHRMQPILGLDLLEVS